MPNHPSLIRIEDLDTIIYRIFPLWLLEQCLRLKQLTLVQPRLWEDPYEILAESVAFTQHNPFRQTFLERYIFPIFAQAWSRTCESDTLLRVYSRVRVDAIAKRNITQNEEGVRVQTTVRKLLKVLDGAGFPPDAYFIGAVDYLSKDDVHGRIADLAIQFGLSKLAQGKPRAELALFKRLQFSHEAEVRLLVIKDQVSNSQSLLTIPFDPNEVFEEITFDPRLISFERIEREEAIRKLGYNGIVSKSDLYQRTLLEILLNESLPS